ncbi:MAG: CdaR family protein [Acutalibacteraceae bacterium]|nr:CdaR family protein [Acutalibacteraceae bacterium]
MKKKKNINSRSLFDNSKFLLLLSFILSCIFWVAFASGSDEESTITISDIPVTIELSDEAKEDGLRVYRGGEATVSVQVKGNRLTVGSITKDDIQVVAQNTSSITVANTYALSLSTKKNGVKTDYEIVSVSPSVINVTVDKEKQQTFNIEKNIDTSSVTLPISTNESISGYYLSKPVISNNTVTVTGPEQEVKQINKVQVSDTISGEQSENITKKLEVQLLDSDGELIESDLINVSPKKVDVTIQILPEKEIEIIPNFVNVPSGMDVDSIASVKPSKITVAATEEELSLLNEIKLDPIDFNTLDPTKTQITCNISLPAGYINISNVEQARVSLDLSDYSSTTIPVTDVELTSVPDGYTAEVSTKSINVSIAGPTDEISDITAESIKASVDLSSLASGFEGSQEMPVKIDLSELNGCWCFKEYTVNVSLKKITE